MKSFDTETALIRPGLQAPPLTCLSLSDGSLYSRREAGEVLASLLDGGELLSGHGVAFDCAVMIVEHPLLMPKIIQAYEEDRIEDTMVRQMLIDTANGQLAGFYREWSGTQFKAVKIEYGLDNLALRHFNAPMDKSTWRLRYGELRDVPIEQWDPGARKYATDDAMATAAVWGVQEQPEHKKWLDDQHRQARAAFWLKLMSIWGLKTDPKAVQAFANKTRADYERIGVQLVHAGLLRPNRLFKSGPRKGQVKEGARDTKAAKDSMRKAFKGAPPLTDGGDVCLDEDACIKSGDPMLKLYAELSSTKKILSTDIPLLQSGTINPIHTNFKVLLETGRTSSSPNVQNLPRRGGIRECFVPRPGYVYAASDYSGMELRTWAQVCISKLGHSRLAQVLNAGQDPHMMMAAAILNCSYEEAEARYKAGDDAADDARQTGKVADFGYPGGLGPEKFVHFAALQYGVILTEERARDLKALWLREWPEAKEYLAAIGRIVEAGDARIEHLFSGRHRGGLTYCDTANSFFQALASDAAKSAGWLIMRACYLEDDSILLRLEAGELRPRRAHRRSAVGDRERVLGRARAPHVRGRGAVAPRRAAQDRGHAHDALEQGREEAHR